MYGNIMVVGYYGGVGGGSSEVQKKRSFILVLFLKPCVSVPVLLLHGVDVSRCILLALGDGI